MNKKVLAELEKCYSIAPLYYKGKNHILVAAEKTDRCILFDTDGNEEQTVWEGPGGVMTMVQVPGTDGQFLATSEFYSPNDAKNAKIVIAEPLDGKWNVRTLVEIPFVHRFDILENDGKRYLIVCCLKSGHEYRDDWSSPGKVYGAVLPEDLSSFDQDHQLELTVIKENMLKNHGYYRVEREGKCSSVVCCDSGVFRFWPPEGDKVQWRIETLINAPASDAVLIDLDGDGRDELFVLSPFHGDTISVYREKEGSYKLEYVHKEKMEFLHAIWGGEVQGKPVVMVGHRKGNRDLLKFFWVNGEYRTEIVDHDCGPANVYGFHKNGKDYLVSANREINEIAMYEL
ncbi:MAG: hypothetical protein SOR79_03860 [Blautia sp.]|uniref:hypothetical protein n=1 Tax=Blautia sp. TaxID=1955243 RepID=UPI002A75D5DC|nr:hypothetical protein [Blautia sp.]MDY3016272.1 hypothetical protein [Blautia sp.]